MLSDGTNGVTTDDRNRAGVIAAAIVGFSNGQSRYNVVIIIPKIPIILVIVVYGGCDSGDIARSNMGLRSVCHAGACRIANKYTDVGIPSDLYHTKHQQQKKRQHYGKFDKALTRLRRLPKRPWHAKSTVCCKMCDAHGSSLWLMCYSTNTAFSI